MKNNMAEQGRTISFQLSTGNVDQLSNVSQTEKGHFVQVLNPPAYIPFYAQPKVALYALSFANTFANVEKSFGNDDIVFQYYDSTATAYKEVTFKIDTGNYNRSDLEIAIAQGLKNDAACWTELTKVAKTVEAKANDDRHATHLRHTHLHRGTTTTPRDAPIVERAHPEGVGP